MALADSGMAIGIVTRLLRDHLIRRGFEVSVGKPETAADTDTAAKDAHDRYANLEISYLFERMARFKGLAILATNRKKDLDEAFLRRLRVVIEFPLPGHEERLRIWREVIPPGVDTSTLDFDFLACRFALAGGHIRAIVFHACLQSASHSAPKELTMPAVIRAVQREYEKLERANSLDQFGHYAPLVVAERSLR
ncbi:MAG: hypothetical protein OEW59_02780 [Gammaproteobacteria bacterium]|nr:hypothetical protein [Gammaproteobacteria bacterium]